MTRPLLEFVARAGCPAREQHRAEPKLSCHRISGSARQGRGGGRALRTRETGRATSLRRTWSSTHRRAAHSHWIFWTGSACRGPKETEIGHRPALCDCDVRDTVSGTPWLARGAAPACRPRAAAAVLLVPVENNCWQVNLTHMHGGALPENVGDFIGFAKTLRTQTIYCRDQGRRTHRSNLSISSFRAAFAGASRRLSVFRIVCCRSAMLSADFNPAFGQGNECRRAGSRCPDTAYRSANVECRSAQRKSRGLFFLRQFRTFSPHHGRRRRATSSARRHAGGARMISASI